MIHVRFKRTKHPKMAVDYLLGENRNRQDAKIIKGDIDLSLEIAEQSEHKNKYSCGCLSFEEADISEELKHKIMNDFERVLFPGLHNNQYDVTWIEHTDKGRLELNYFIPQVELTTGKSLTAYYHQADGNRVRDYVEITNQAYELTNPSDKPPDLTRLNWAKRTPQKIIDTGERIAREIIAKRPNIGGEEQIMVIYTLAELGYEIAKRKSGKNIGKPAVTKDSISIVNPDNPDGPNIRLKGLLFAENKNPIKPTPEEIGERLGEAMTKKQVVQQKRYPVNPIDSKVNYEQSKRNQSIINQCNQLIAKSIRHVKQAEPIQSGRSRYRQWHEHGNQQKVFERKAGKSQSFTL